MSEFPKTITLPISGGVLTVQRRLKGRDLRMADRVSGKNADTMQKGFAMLAQVVLLNGQPVLMEDIDEWDLDDINAAYRALGMVVEEEGQEKKSQIEESLPPSSNGGSLPLN